MINLGQDEIQAEEFVWKSEFDEDQEIEANKQKSAGNKNIGNLKNDSKNGESIASKTSDLLNEGENSNSENDQDSLQDQSKESTSYLGMISNSFNSWFRVGFEFCDLEFAMKNLNLKSRRDYGNLIPYKKFNLQKELKISWFIR